MNLRRPGRGGRNDWAGCRAIKRSGRRRPHIARAYRKSGTRLRSGTIKAVGRIHPVKNRRAVCATRRPSAGAVDLMPSTLRYYCADNGAGQSTYRRKDLHEVRIGGVTAVEEGAFGTVSLDKIRG